MDKRFLQHLQKEIAGVRDAGLYKEEVGYRRRSLVETAMHRVKALTGSTIRARTSKNQAVKIVVKMFVLNEMMTLRS